MSRAHFLMSGRHAAASTMPEHRGEDQALLDGGVAVVSPRADRRPSNWRRSRRRLGKPEAIATVTSKHKPNWQQGLAPDRWRLETERSGLSQRQLRAQVLPSLSTAQSLENKLASAERERLKPSSRVFLSALVELVPPPSQLMAAFTHASAARRPEKRERRYRRLLPFPTGSFSGTRLQRTLETAVERAFGQQQALVRYRRFARLLPCSPLR